MSDALLHTISNVLVLVLTAGIGWLAAQTGKLDDTGRITTAKIVNLSIPFFLFNSVTTKFTHDQLVELLGMAWLPFVTVCLNLLISLALIRLGLVRRELSGTFTAAFTGSTVLFVGVPMTTALFGEEGIPYLLVYFFANCVFIWTVALYAIQTDGVAKTGGARPKLVSMKSVRMLFSPPLLSFIVGIAFVVLSIPIPHFVAATVKSFGSVTSPLALFFIGMTIFRMPYAAPIAVLVGSTALIPVFGAFIGTAIGAFLILFNSPIKALWFVVFIIVLQQLEGNLIYPRVVGQSVGLPGIWVLFAVTVGGSAFGFVGMLISVPVCSVLYTLCDTYIRCRLRDKAAKKEKAGE